MPLPPHQSGDEKGVCWDLAFLQSTASIQHDLLWIKHPHFDLMAHKVVTHPLDTYYIEFTHCLDLHPAADSFSFDLALVFWSGMSRDIQDEGLAAAYAPPPGLPNECKEGSLEQLMEVKMRVRPLRDRSSMSKLKSITPESSSTHLEEGLRQLAPLQQFPIWMC